MGTKTKEQISYNMIQSELDKIFKKLERGTRNNKYFKIKYKSGRRVPYINNPIRQMPGWKTEKSNGKG